MITTDFISCIWEYRMRGLDILLFQIFVSFKSMLDILIHESDSKKQKRILGFKFNFERYSMGILSSSILNLLCERTF